MGRIDVDEVHIKEIRVWNKHWYHACIVKIGAQGGVECNCLFCVFSIHLLFVLCQQSVGARENMLNHVWILKPRLQGHLTAAPGLTTIVIWQPPWRETIFLQSSRRLLGNPVLMSPMPTLWWYHVCINWSTICLFVVL